MRLAVQKRGKMKIKEGRKTQALIPALLNCFLQKHLFWPNDDRRENFLQPNVIG